MTFKRVGLTVVIFLIPAGLLYALSVIYNSHAVDLMKLEINLGILTLVPIYLSVTGCILIKNNCVFSRRDRWIILSLAMFCNMVSLTMQYGLWLWEYVFGIDINMDYVSQIIAICHVVFSAIILLVSYLSGCKILYWRNKKVA